MVHFTRRGRAFRRTLAPVIPLFGGQSARRRSVEPAQRPTTRLGVPSPSARSTGRTTNRSRMSRAAMPIDVPRRARGPTTRCVRSRRRPSSRSLARRGLSISEAKARLRADGLTDDESATVIDDFVERGWLDDAVLAEQLVHAATTARTWARGRSRQLLMKRRHRVARSSTRRMTELPDDDAERALEFARTKARSLARLDDDTATAPADGHARSAGVRRVGREHRRAHRAGGRASQCRRVGRAVPLIADGRRRHPPSAVLHPTARRMAPIMTNPSSAPTIIAPSPAAHAADGRARTYEVRTFGCQMNVHDSERLSGSLESAGYVPRRSSAKTPTSSSSTPAPSATTPPASCTARSGT